MLANGFSGFGEMFVTLNLHNFLTKKKKDFFIP